MRVFQTILAGLVAIALIAGGLAVAAVVAVAALAVVLVNRLLGRKPVVRARFQTSARPQPAARPRGEAIDVEATEVSTPPPRLDRP